MDKLNSLSDDEKEALMKIYENNGKIEIEDNGEKIILEKDKNEIKMQKVIG